MRRLSALLCWLWLACESAEPIAAEPPGPRGLPASSQARELAGRPRSPDQAEADRPRPPPTLGDPLGLLSKPEPSPAGRKVAAEIPGDPGALMRDAELEPPSRVLSERDPRALARSKVTEPLPTRAGGQGAVRIRERSASDLLRSVRQERAPHVLLLHASYCKACRKVMPGFVAMARAYRGRGVGFTAASVDRDASAFEAHTPALGGLLEPFWIVPDGSLPEALRNAGVAIEGNSFSIPLFAVFRERKLVAQGHNRELHELPRLLDSFL